MLMPDQAPQPEALVALVPAHGTQEGPSPCGGWGAGRERVVMETWGQWGRRDPSNCLREPSSAPRPTSEQPGAPRLAPPGLTG